MSLNANVAYGYPTFTLWFHPYWNNLDPEDGAYTVIGDNAFEDPGPYEVYIEANYGGLLLQSQPGTTVYVTHVNGKIQVTICSVTLGGDEGFGYVSTTASGELGAP